MSSMLTTYLVCSEMIWIVYKNNSKPVSKQSIGRNGARLICFKPLTLSCDICLIHINLILGKLFLKNVDLKIRGRGYSVLFPEMQKHEFLKKESSTTRTPNLHSCVVHYKSFFCGISYVQIRKFQRLVVRLFLSSQLHNVTYF